VRRKPLPDVSAVQDDMNGGGGGGGRAGPQQAPAPNQAADDSENFDYLAYVVDYSDSPRSGAYQSPPPQAPPPGAAQGHVPGPGETSANMSAGYGSGKFSTNLEDLR
jgi:hypothetical protein